MSEELNHIIGRLLMLELQNEELETALEKESEQHRKASQRATAYERRNKSLRDDLEKVHEDLHRLSHCWSCPDLGNHEQCQQCSNGALMILNGDHYIWRGFHDDT